MITIEGSLASSLPIKDDTLYLTAQENDVGAEEHLGVSNSKATYKYKGENNGYVTITSAGSYLNKITISTPPAFGAAGFDSGYYYAGGDRSEVNKRGVIRFFQEFVGQKVDDYGFVFIKESGETETYYSKRLAGGPQEFTQDEIEGFYGDIDDIDNLDETIIAKGFVKIGENYYYSDKTITGTIKKGDEIDDYPSN